MNLLITCVGRRVTLIKQIRKTLNKNGLKLVVNDQDEYAPALYYADKYYHFKGQDTAYIDNLIDICHMNNCDSIITLIDPHLKLLRTYEKKLYEAGIRLIMSTKEVINNTYDKNLFYKTFKEKISIPPTSIVKYVYGSSGYGYEKVIQPYIEGKEYNVQCYFDYYTTDLIDCFMQEKIWTRAGETERSLSIWDDEIYREIRKLGREDFRGPVDIDVIKSDKVYVIDINPRFGGGYPMAHASGVDFTKYLVHNLMNKDNEIKEAGYYKTGKKFMKYDELEVVK